MLCYVIYFVIKNFCKNCFLLFFLFIIIIIIIIIVIQLIDKLFFHVPGCSGMFHVPGFIDARKKSPRLP